MSHDANGSTIRKIVAGQATTYVYNLENRLSEVRDNSGATVATYGYDPFGRRLWKETGGSRRYFVYSEEGLVAELDASGAVIQGYGYEPQSTYGTAPLYTRTSAGYAYYQLDHLGTPQLITDKSGKIVWQGRARAFGETAEVVNEVSNPLRFPGQYEDGETGLFYNYFRYYDSKTGRYVTSDPIGMLAGLSLYGYVNNNPLKGADPYGLLTCTYSIESHKLSCINNNGERLVTDMVLSGKGDCKNNASVNCQDKNKEGPLPVDNYIIYSPNQTKHKKGWMFLESTSGIDSDNRTGIFIHPGSKSEGCVVITDTSIYNTLGEWANQDNGGMLVVNP